MIWLIIHYISYVLACTILASLAYQIVYEIYWKLFCRPSFKNQKILITGASSGIGEQLAYQLSSLQANTLYLASRRTQELERVKNKCLLINPNLNVMIFKIDLEYPLQILQFSQSFQYDLDILVNNGGISQRDEFKNSDFSIAQRLVNINTLSPIALIKGFLPKLIEQKHGQIVNILSVAGQVGTPLRTYYSTSKFGLDGFGKAVQSEIAQYNIHILQCYPAYVQTNVSKNALVGKGDSFGKTDSNISNGIPVDLAVQDLVKAMYLKRHQITLGSYYYILAPKLVSLSENLTYVLGIKNYQQQIRAKQDSKQD